MENTGTPSSGRTILVLFHPTIKQFFSKINCPRQASLSLPRTGFIEDFTIQLEKNKLKKVTLKLRLPT